MLFFQNKKFHQDRRLAGLMFLAHMHATSWGPTNPEGELFVDRYANGTTGLFDRMKFVFKPDRVMEGTCTAHSFTAKPGYKTCVLKQ
ncbi:hypothetical protein DPMN_013645 [Dreissena polymorpha]|uniref:Uncharacterized protein n=1 Tax=Dreissena polymorpha TaxID=45954 RepID=A0A9D4N855_DREPO|nr:hypothetical protein DPMN_013645 [Dreissena polymorpha]